MHVLPQSKLLRNGFSDKSYTAEGHSIAIAISPAKLMPIRDQLTLVIRLFMLLVESDQESFSI